MKSIIDEIIWRTSNIIPTAFDMHGNKFNSNCYLELTDKTYKEISERFNLSIEESKKLVEEFY